VIIKNINQVINEPAMELALLALPIEKLAKLSSEIPGNCSAFKDYVGIIISKKEQQPFNK
jgi:hypothetical protein